MNKQNSILAVLLVVQVVIIAILLWPGGEHEKVARVFFADLDIGKVDRILIADDEENEAVLERVNGQWFIDIGMDEKFPAEQLKVKNFLHKLGGLQSRQIVTRTDSSHERLKVGEQAYNRRIQLESGDKSWPVLYLGSAPNYKTIHVRSKNDDAVYLVRDLSAWEASAESMAWWQTRYINVPADNLQAITVKNDHGDFRLLKNADGQWRLPDQPEQKLSTEKVATFLESVSQVSFTDIIKDRDFKPSTPMMAVVRLQTDDKDTELKIWAKEEEEGDYVMKSPESGFYVKAGMYELEDILQTQAADFMKDAESEKSPGSENEE